MIIRVRELGSLATTLFSDNNIDANLSLLSDFILITDK